MNYNFISLKFSQKLSFSFLCENLRNFPRIFSAAILDALDLKNLIKNILRFIAFDLIFHLPYVFKCFEKTEPCKIYAENIFETIFAILGNLNFEQGHIFLDFIFRIEVKVAIGYI